MRFELICRYPICENFVPFLMLMNPCKCGGVRVDSRLVFERFWCFSLMTGCHRINDRKLIG